MIRLSLAPPNDLMPPASLTISTASFAAATQPTPICAMLPVVGESAPILTGSAAQPRSGTAPNAPAASTPPVLSRNLRRACPFDRGRLGGPLFSRTDCRRSFVIPFPPVRSGRSAPAVRFVRLEDRSPAQYCLQ